MGTYFWSFCGKVGREGALSVEWTLPMKMSWDLYLFIYCFEFAVTKFLFFDVFFQWNFIHGKIVLCNAGSKLDGMRIQIRLWGDHRLGEHVCLFWNLKFGLIILLRYKKSRTEQIRAFPPDRVHFRVTEVSQKINIRPFQWVILKRVKTLSYPILGRVLLIIH